MAKKRKIIISAALITIVILFTGLFMFQKFMNHESSQSQRLADLEARVGLIEAKDKLAESPTDEIIPWGGGTNYLAIGNSITKHLLADYWWNECGMAATSADKDYYHIVLNYLKEKDDISSNVYNFSIWELLYTDRAETLEALDYYLEESLDLITVQLGENAHNLDTFESDFEYLINHIKEKCPFAEIIVIGDFWENENRDEMKKKAAEKCGVKYISLNEIKDNKEYQCGIGTEVFGEDGETHIVEHAGVAAHPNDKAMEYIADKIIESISK